MRLPDSRRAARTSWVTLVALVASLSLMLAACGPGGDGESVDTTASDGQGSDLPKIRVSAGTGGLASVAVTAMQVNNFDIQNGFEGEYFFRDFAALIPFFLEGHSDISMSGDPIQTAIARQEGYEVTNFHAYLTNNTCIAVKSDSPYETPEDLVGENVGHFGVDSGTTATFVILLQEYFGINPLDDYEMVEAAPPVLPELLANGDVEAIMDFVPHLTRAIVEADARCLFGPVHQVLAERNHEIANYIGLMMAHETYLAENADLVDRYLQAWSDTVDWIEANPEAIAAEPFASLVGQSNPDVLEQFAKDVTEIPLFVDEWSPEIIAGLERFLDLATEEGTLIQENPGGTFSNAEDFR